MTKNASSAEPATRDAESLSSVVKLQEPGVLSWERLLPLVHGDEPVHKLQHIVLLLDGCGDAAAARQEVAAAVPGLVPRWLSWQVAVSQRSVEELDGWLAGSSSADPEALVVGTELLRGLLRPGGRHSPPGSSATHHGWLLLLALEQRWQELADLLEQGSPDEQLLAAAVWGELCDDRSRQVELLLRHHEQMPLLVSESLLDLAAAGQGELAAALERSAEALRADGCVAAAEAALAALLVLGRATSSRARLLTLDEPSSARAWRCLQLLIERLVQQASAPQLAERYLAASDAGERLAAVLRVRAAEIWIGRREWTKALQALPVPAEGVVGPGLIRTYRWLALVQLGRWGELASQLTEAEAGSEQQGFQLMVAALLASRQPEAGGAVLRSTARLLPKLAANVQMLAGPAVLAGCREAGALDDVARVWEVLADSSPDLEQGGLCAFAAGVSRLRTGRLDEALASLGRARERAGDSPALLAGLAIALRGKEDWAALLEVLMRLVERISGEGRTGLLKEAVYIATVKAREPAAAIPLIDRLAALQPMDADIIESAAAVHLQAARYGEAAALLERAAELRDGERAADLRWASGQLSLERLHDAQAAEAAFRRALASDPRHRQASEGLHALLIRDRRHEELIPLLIQTLELQATEADRKRRLLELAAIHRKIWENNGAPDMARACIRWSDEVLKLDPENEVATKYIVTLLQKLQQWDEMIRRFPAPVRTISALRGVCLALERTEHWAELAEASWQLAERTAPSRESLTFILRAGQIFEGRLEKLEEAARCYQWARQQVKSPEATRRLADLMRRMERHAELAQLLEELLPVAKPPEQVRLRAELGGLYAGPLRNPAAAIRHYSTLADLHPDDEEPLVALESLLRSTDRKADLIRTLERHAALLVDKPEELPLLLQLGRLCQEQGDHVTALRLATRLCHAAHTDREFVTFIEEVFAEAERWGEICQLYEQLVASLGTAANTRVARAEILVRKGRIELAHLNLPEEAAGSFVQALELNPDDAAIVKVTEELLTRNEDWQRLKDFYERLSNSRNSVAERVAALRQAAHIAQHALHDEAETGRIYERIQALDPTDVESFTYIGHKLERRKEFRRLAELLIDHVDVANTEEQAQLLLRAGVVSERANDNARAAELYIKALQIDPGSRQAMARLARFYEAQETWDKFLEITRRQIDAEEGRAERALLFFRCGSVIESKYGDDEGAIQYYEAAVESSPTYLPALHSLRDLYSRRQDWKGVVRTLSTESAAWVEPKGKASVLAQIAEIYAARLHDQVQALRLYKLAIETHAENMPAALALFEANVRASAYEEAAKWGALYSAQVEQRGHQGQKAAFYPHWGNVLRNVGRHAEAAVVYFRALEVRPNDANTLFAILDLCEEAPEAHDYAASTTPLLKAVAKPDEAATVTAVAFAIYGVLAEHRNDTQAALDFYERAVQMLGEEIRIAKLLADLWVHLGDDAKAVALIEHCRDAAGQQSFGNWIAASLWLLQYHFVIAGNAKAAIDLASQVLQVQPNRIDVRTYLAHALVALEQHGRAQAELQTICEQLGIQGENAEVLAERHLELGMAASRAGNREMATAAWRRAMELAPQLAGPGAALVRDQLRQGNPARAQQELERAKARLRAFDFDLCSLEAEIEAQRAGVGAGMAVLRGALTHSPSPQDRLVIARHLRRLGQPEDGLRQVRQVFAEDPDLLPAAADLSELASRLGNDALSRRARQVLLLMSGEEAGLSWAPLPPGSLRGDIWNQLRENLSADPLDQVWRLLAPQIARHCRVELPFEREPIKVDLQRTIIRVADIFEIRLTISKHKIEYLPPQLGETELAVPASYEQLSLPEVSAWLVMVGAAVKAGYGLLFNFTPERRRELALTLAALRINPGSPPPEAARWMETLSRHERRQLEALLAIPLAGEELLPAADSWLAEIDRFCIAVTLLVSGDLGSVASILGVHAGVPEQWIGRWWLSGPPPEIPMLCKDYISDRFDEFHGPPLR